MDYLIWIGESYSQVLCNRNSCAIKTEKRKSHCYVHEAEWRGCCRKVPQIPPKAEVGKTRIFLANRDKLKKKEMGRIFGYYVLSGIEVIKGVESSQYMPLQNFRKVKSSAKGNTRAECWDGSIISDPSLVDERCPILPQGLECKEGDAIRKICADDSIITTYTCESGHWVKTNKKCDDDIVIENGDEEEIPYFNSPDQTMFETERACSLRLKPGSIYFTDALTRDITKYFKECLEKVKFNDEYLKAKTASEREDIIKNGRKLFTKAIEVVKSKRQISTVIPEELNDLAELKGEFIFFKNKIVFEKYPRASFLGLLEIDGDKILEQISENISPIELIYPNNGWLARLATKTKSSQAYTKTFINELIEISIEELNANEEFKISNFGKFHFITTKKRDGVNPSTGEKIKIPSKKRVRFKPYKKIKEIEEENISDETQFTQEK